MKLDLSALVLDQTGRPLPPATGMSTVGRVLTMVLLGAPRDPVSVRENSRRFELGIKFSQGGEVDLLDGDCEMITQAMMQITLPTLVSGQVQRMLAGLPPLIEPQATEGAPSGTADAAAPVVAS